MQDFENPLRNLPQVQRLLEMPAAHSLCVEFGRTAVTNALRETLEGLREQIGAGVLAGVPDAQTVLAHAGEKLAVRRRRGLRRTINATGIVLHTNLGRAPLAPELGSGTVERTEAFVGGGSLPEERIESRAVALHPRIGAEEAAGLLRSGHPAVIGRIKDGRLLLDMLTVSDGELPELAGALRTVLA